MTSLATDVPYWSDSRHALVLAAGVAKSLSVPASAAIMVLSATANVWVQYGSAAVLPTSDNTSGNAPELNPAARHIAGTASIGLVSAQDCLVSIAFYGR